MGATGFGFGLGLTGGRVAVATGVLGPDVAAEAGLLAAVRNALDWPSGPQPAAAIAATIAAHTAHRVFTMPKSRKAHLPRAAERRKVGRSTDVAAAIVCW